MAARDRRWFSGAYRTWPPMSTGPAQEGQGGENKEQDGAKGLGARNIWEAFTPWRRHASSPSSTTSPLNFYSRRRKTAFKVACEDSSASLRKVHAGRLKDVVGSNIEGDSDLPRLAKRVPQTEWVSVLRLLQKVPIFSLAKAEERKKLSQCVRTMKVPDASVLIKEGVVASNPAIFIIAQGSAHVCMSLAFNSSTSSSMDVEVTELHAEEYFGEGMVLTGNPAYASIRANHGLVVYVLLQSDLDAVISSETRRAMLHCHQQRQWKKANASEVWRMLKDDDDGMQALRRFCATQHVMEYVDFFDAVQQFKRTVNLATEEQQSFMIEAIHRKFLSSDGSSPPKIAASESQKHRIELQIGEERLSRQCSGSSSSSAAAVAVTNNPSADDEDGELPAQEFSVRQKTTRVSTDLEKNGIEALFDSIMSGSVDMTLTQDIIPVFVESSLFFDYLNYKFPLTTLKKKPKQRRSSEGDKSRSSSRHLSCSSLEERPSRRGSLAMISRWKSKASMRRSLLLLGESTSFKSSCVTESPAKSAERGRSLRMISDAENQERKMPVPSSDHTMTEAELEAPLYVETSTVVHQNSFCTIA